VEANNGSSGQSLSDFTILKLQNKIAALEAEVEKFTSTNTARDEICCNIICEYCEGCVDLVPKQGYSCFMGRKLSPVA